MSRMMASFRDLDRRLKRLAPAAIVALMVGGATGSGPADKDVKKADPEKTKVDRRLDGYRTPSGFKLRVVAAEPTILDPAAMAFDDRGALFVAEWRPAERTFEVRDTLSPPEGEPTQIRRTRKSTTDLVKKLKDADGDGVYESSEVVLDGCEMPTSIVPWKNSLLLTCVGRLERWGDEDGDGHFETRTVLLDGFAAIDRRGLVGATLGQDGWLYLAVGDNDNHVVGPDGSKVDLARTGGVVRCRPDGSRLAVVALGLRNPYKGLAFDGHFDPFLIDGDDEDGSKLQGMRLINPTEEGDYGWRLRAGATGGLADFDHATVDGEAPGRLGVLARLGRGSASGMVAYDGVAFPEVMRNTLILPDPSRRIVRGFKVDLKEGSRAFRGESTLMAAEDDRFRPIQVAVGPDGAILILDQRGAAPGDRPPGGDGKAGRLYRMTWEGEKGQPAPTLKPAHWDRIAKATVEEIILKYLTSNDHGEAERALHELVERGTASLIHFLGWAANPTAPTYSRLLAIQGARQFWCDQVEGVLLTLLGDADPDVRRLAAQGLGWEPKTALPRLVPKLLPRLDDPDVRVVREAALAIGRHAEPKPQQVSAVLLRWLIAHPGADPTVKDALIRALERLGDPGIEEVALAIRTRRGVEREAAVAIYTAFRTGPAAERLSGLVKIPDLETPERVALIRQFNRFPGEVQAPTQGLADWLVRHSEVDPPIKVAALDACRLAGNPASALVKILLDDEDDSVRLAAARIAARSRPPGTLEFLTDRLKNKETPVAERLSLIKALGVAGPKAFDALDAAYLGSEDPAFRRAALRSMTDADRARAVPALESTLTGPDAGLRALAAAILAESPQTVGILGKAFTDGNLGREELPTVVEGLRRHDSRENRKRLAAIEDGGSSGPAAIGPAEIRERLARGGDPWAGLGVFFRESSQCSACHSVAGRGSNFGPTLTLGGSSPTAEALIESILSPWKAIDSKYDGTRVTLNDRRSMVGLVIGRDEKSVTLREPGGREVRIARELVDRESAEPGSPMPGHVSFGLTPDEIVDVVAFLRSKPVQEALKHGPRKVDRGLAIGPFALGSDRTRVPLDRVESAKSYEGQDGSRATWVALEATHDGLFNLRGELAAKPGRAYLATEIRSAADQAAALRFAVEGATRVYLNGARLADVAERDSPGFAHAFAKPANHALPALPDLARLNLKGGSNLLLIAVDRSDDRTGDVRALFEILSPAAVEIRTPRN